MSFINSIKEKAKTSMKTIVLPEATDRRIIIATSKILSEGFANIVLLGNKELIQNIAKENSVDISKAIIIDPENSDKYEYYVENLFEIRKNKGMDLETAKKLIKDPVYYGTMMVKMNDADGLVSGAIHSTSDTLRPALQILKTAPNTKLVSAFFLMVLPNTNYGEDGIFVFSDCGLNENPNAEELSEIAISSADSFRMLVNKEPKVAMLSYSTYGSANSEMVKKVADATELTKQKMPSLLIDGELQFDAAVVPEVAETKAKNSVLHGKANTLIFPDLNSGNIGYKITQRLANAEAYGPLCQGIAKPVNDLSRGCSSDDIVGVVAITAVQSQINML